MLANLIGIFIGFAIGDADHEHRRRDRRLLRLQPDPADRGRHPQRAQRHLRGHRALDRVQHRADAAVQRRLHADRRGVGADRHLRHDLAGHPAGPRASGGCCASSSSSAAVPGHARPPATSRVPFTRLVRVELRKSHDTRAGFWLLVAIVGDRWSWCWHRAGHHAGPGRARRCSATSSAIAAYIISFLLPILAIMLVTSEWSQRTRAGHLHARAAPAAVVLAKLVVGVLLTLLTLVVAFGHRAGLHGDLRARPARPDLAGSSGSTALGRLRRHPDAGDARRLRARDAAAQHPGGDRAVLRLPVRAARASSPRLTALSGWFEDDRALARLPGRPGRHLRVEPLRRRGVGAPDRVRAALAGPAAGARAVADPAGRGQVAASAERPARAPGADVDAGRGTSSIVSRVQPVSEGYWIADARPRARRAGSGVRSWCSRRPRGPRTCGRRGRPARRRRAGCRRT